MEALLEEWEMRKEAFFALLEERQENIHTIYIGGGTPSTLDSNDLEKLLQTILHQTTQHHTTAQHPLEITLEVNPGDLTAEKAAAWHQTELHLRKF